MKLEKALEHQSCSDFFYTCLPQLFRDECPESKKQRHEMALIPSFSVFRYVMLYHVVLLSILLLMVKLLLQYLIGNQGMLPIPTPVRVNAVVSGNKEKETGNHSFHLLLTHLREKRYPGSSYLIHIFEALVPGVEKRIQGTEKKRGEQQIKPACFLVSYYFSAEIEICTVCYPLHPLISPFHAQGGLVDAPICTDKSIM